MLQVPENDQVLNKPSEHEPGQERFRIIHSEDIVWKPFPAFPPTARLAILVGDPTKEGPYVIRVKLPAGTKMLPHKHPEDRIYTVISGVFYIGLGECFDESKLTAHSPGSVLILPGGQPHFHWAKSGEYVTQVSAIGPLGLSYLDPNSDPRNTVPPDCKGTIYSRWLHGRLTSLNGMLSPNLTVQALQIFSRASSAFQIRPRR